MASKAHMIVGAVGLTLGPGCVAPEPPDTGDQAPVVGRIQTRDGITDLTVDSFGDAPTDIPKQSYARVLADIEPALRADDEPADDSALGIGLRDGEGSLARDRGKSRR